MKPNKIVYENQKEIHDFIINKLKSSCLKYVKEAYLIGSLADGKFGKYKEEYEGQLGSDIDVVAIPMKIKSNWKYQGDFYNWHKKYDVEKIKIKNIQHSISFMLPFNENINLFWKIAKQLNWKVEKLK